MDKKDLKIICYLRQNARETLTNMSKKTKIPVSTIYERLKSQNGGLITKHTSLIDFNKLGYSTKAHIMIKVGKNSRDNLKKYLMNYNQINSLYKINNGFDFMIEGIFKHLRELEDFFEDLDEKFLIENKEVYYVIDDLKRETFLSDPVFAFV